MSCQIQILDVDMTICGVEGNHNGVNVRPSVDKHHPTVVTWADVVREK